MVVVDATREGNIKGFGLPLKLDLARRTVLLHDDEITGSNGTFDEVADIMMNPAKRDPRAAHPFFVPDPTECKAVIEFLKSLGTSPVTFTPQGVGNAASYMSGPVAFGEIIAISAIRLGIPTASASAQNTQVTFDNIPASLISVTSTQITAMVPYEIASSTTALKVVIAGQSAPVITLNVALTAPGIFTLTGPTGLGDQAAVLNQDGTVNSKANPAARGSAIAIYGTGEGETFPQASDGTITSPSNIPKPVAATSVTIDGQDAQVQYACSAPGLVAGVLQVNAVVPASASSGAVQISVAVGGVSSQSQTIIWLKYTARQAWLIILNVFLHTLPLHMPMPLCHDYAMPTPTELRNKLLNHPIVERLRNNPNWKPAADAALDHFIDHKKCTVPSWVKSSTWKQVEMAFDEIMRG